MVLRGTLGLTAAARRRGVIKQPAPTDHHHHPPRHKFAADAIEKIAAQRSP
jgi:hypothetical protein